MNLKIADRKRIIEDCAAIENGLENKFEPELSDRCIEDIQSLIIECGPALEKIDILSCFEHKESIYRKKTVTRKKRLVCVN